MKVFLLLFERSQTPTDTSANNNLFAVWDNNRPQELVGVLNTSWNSEYSSVSTSQYNVTVSPTLIFMGVAEEMQNSQARVVEVHRLVGADITEANIRARITALSYLKPPAVGEGGSIFTVFPTPGADPSGGYGGINPGLCEALGLPCGMLWLAAAVAGVVIGAKSQDRIFKTIFFGGAAYSGYRYYKSKKPSIGSLQHRPLKEIR